MQCSVGVVEAVVTTSEVQAQAVKALTMLDRSARDI